MHRRREHLETQPNEMGEPEEGGKESVRLLGMGKGTDFVWLQR